MSCVQLTWRRVQRHLAFKVEFTSDVQHVPDDQNVVADTLSRTLEVVPTSESTTVTGVKVPSGSLADFLHLGGTALPLLVSW